MRKIILYVLLVLLGVASCTNYDTNPVVPQQYDGVPLVILDTDIGSSTDDLFALEFLYHYQQQGKCKLLGVVVDREGENSAACVDVMNTYFNCGHLPIKQVYATCSCNTGQRMWDPLAVINAIEGDALFTFSGRGTVAITDAAETIFTPTSSGDCRYQHPGDATWYATMLDKIRTVNKTTQNIVSAIADRVWQFALSHPDGFTLHITSMTQPTEGIAVSYAATQNSHSRNQLDKVVSHALEHDGYVGGWLNKDNELYYFDSTRLFPEDQLDEALKFGKENGQNSVFILSSGVEVPVE